MMRSMYSAVSGLKTHQTKMDVIGNNIANVNTVAFKSSSVTFSDILYQTTSNASGANAATGVGGVNAKQIGLGVTAAATKISITSAGAAETTGDGLDIRLADSNTTNFFIVNNGSENLFTRSGAFYVDGAGNLCMTTTGYNVMGWQVDPTTGEIQKDTVSALRVMKQENLTSAPEATTNGTVSGILDKNDSDVTSDAGKIMTLNFYDDLGYQYTARFAVRAVNKDQCQYSVELSALLDSEGNDLIANFTNAQKAALFGNAGTDTASYTIATSATGNATTDDPAIADGTAFYNTADSTYYYKISDTSTVALTAVTDAGGNVTGYTYTDPTTTDTVTLTPAQVFGFSATDWNNISSATSEVTGTITTDATTGVPTYNVITPVANYTLKFSTADGTFSYINSAGQEEATLNLASSGLFPNGNFKDISIDFSQSLNQNNGGKSTIGADSGDLDGTTGKGKKLGAMIGLSVDTSGKIYGTYDNGNTTLLGQIAVAQFANASGLEKVGDNCYTTTLNSGDFDGIGVDISADGSSMTTGELEMSNVDLSTEFTQMIITQRGFQANSRVITTSDTLLEELVNLKR